MTRLQFLVLVKFLNLIVKMLKTGITYSSHELEYFTEEEKEISKYINRVAHE